MRTAYAYKTEFFQNKPGVIAKDKPEKGKLNQKWAIVAYPTRFEGQFSMPN